MHLVAVRAQDYQVRQLIIAVVAIEMGDFEDGWYAVHNARNGGRSEQTQACGN
jgi:hypothetical protein